MPFVFSPDSRQLASSSPNAALIYLEDILTGEISQTLHCEGDDGYDIWEMKFSPNGSKIATISGTEGNPNVSVVQLWDTRTGILQQTINDRTAGGEDIAFSPDGTRIARCRNSGVIQIWETINDLNQIALERHLNPVGGIDLSTDAMLVASMSHSFLGYSCIKIWDATTGNLQKTFEALEDKSEMTQLKFSPDNMRMASGYRWWVQYYRSGIDLWDISTGRNLRTLQAPRHLQQIPQVIKRYFASHHDFAKPITFSPNGRMVASGYDREYCFFRWQGPPRTIFLSLTIRVWSSISGTLQKTLRGHRGRVTAIAFSSDNKKLASASEDCTIRIWDISKPDTGLNFFTPLRRTFGSQASRIIKTSELVHHIQFSTCHEYLITEIGEIGLGLKIREFNSRSSNFTQDLSVDSEWVCYQKRPFLWLPIEFRQTDARLAHCEPVVRGDVVVIGTESGRVLVFRFDRSALQSFFAHSTDERESEGLKSQP
ncbi:WD40 repeat-like protein [Penicillium herquei]|nr:WD40 repeat-like protein [Penicillium herquei]